MGCSLLLVPGLTAIKAILCIIVIMALIDLVKADIRADIRADIQREHIDTRVWLRDWFDPKHSHLGNANDEEVDDE
jgi:hypothetical protein